MDAGRLGGGGQFQAGHRVLHAPPAPSPPAGADGRAGDFACDGISLLSRVPLDQLDEIDFEGAWSVYPYLPSGTILVSDIQNGLFVVSLQ